MTGTQLTKFNQENVCSLLCFDDKYYQLIRSSVDIKMFEFPYDKIVEKAISYIDKYKEPPKDNIADEVEGLIGKEDGQKFQDALVNIYSINERIKEHQFNSKFVVDKLLEFIKTSTWTEAFYKAAQLHQQGHTDEAQVILDKAKKTSLTIFDPGLKVTDYDNLFQSLEEDVSYPTGIQALDDLGIGPAPGQLFLLVAPREQGKSWFGIQLGARSALNQLKVAHISLEINRNIVQQRYVQHLAAITRWQYKNVITSPLFQRDGNGFISGYKKESLSPQPISLLDVNARGAIEEKLKRLKPILDENLRIHAFNSAQLTIPMLSAYLEGLEQTENFIPNHVVLDQPINMSMDRTQLRFSLEALYIGLRGLAGERNIAISVFHHMNREGTKSTHGGSGTDISEAWNIMGIVDTALIMQRKESERKAGLARLHVDRARSQRSGMTILITQNYDIGQFCLDSELLPDGYDPSGPNFSAPIISGGND